MTSYLDDLAHDFHYACRGLSHYRRFSLVAICALALGISASTVVFSVADNVFFRQFPYKDFSRSVVFEIRGTSDVGGFRLVTLGIFAGLLASYCFTRVLASHVSGVGTTDCLTFAGVIVIVGTAALAACCFPASRAANADPLETLRHE